MIPLLEDPHLAVDGRVLSATVLLRMYEMLEYGGFLALGLPRYC